MAVDFSLIQKELLGEGEWVGRFCARVNRGVGVGGPNEKKISRF